MHQFKDELAKSTQSKVLSHKNDRTLNWLDLVTWLSGWGRDTYGWVLGREVGKLVDGSWG